jgi:hypothetical protein
MEANNEVDLEVNAEETSRSTCTCSCVVTTAQSGIIV